MGRHSNAAINSHAILTTGIHGVTSGNIVGETQDQNLEPNQVKLDDNEKLILGTGGNSEIFDDGTNTIFERNGAWLTVGDTLLLLSRDIGGFTAGARSLGTDMWYFDSVYTEKLILQDGEPEPGTVANFAQIYVDSADGDLKIKFGDGTVKLIVTDT